VQGAFRIQEMQITATAKVWATNHIREARRAQKSCNNIVKQNRAQTSKNARFLKLNETNRRNKLSKLNKLNETNHVRNVINEECGSGSKVAIAKSVQSNDMCDVNDVSTLLGHKEKERRVQMCLQLNDSFFTSVRSSA